MDSNPTYTGVLALSELRAEVERRTPATMWEDASVGWYTTSVKLDLEAKGLITKEGSPQQLRIVDEPALGATRSVDALQGDGDGGTG